MIKVLITALLALSTCELCLSKGLTEDNLLIPDSDNPEVVTPLGTFRGLKKTLDGGEEVYVFLGIPFAKPPVGDRRFRKPEPTDKLTETFDATTLPNSCHQTVATTFHDGFRGEEMWQPNTNLSEDCLYLNIWVPKKALGSELASVFFWIYGGGYFSGTSTLDVYDGAVLAAKQGLVVVSSQYRVGPHGFLYFGTDDAPGNMGLVDQSLALRWTRENIQNFGGDPDSITIAGESCGAASVGFHLISPLSKSNFKRAIMSSGLPTAKYAFKSQEELKSRSFKFAKLAGCGQKEIPDIVECLRKADSEKLTALQWKLYKDVLDFPFSATVDNYFLPDNPEKLFSKGKAKRADLLVGTVRDEGTYFIMYHYLKYFSHLKSTSVPHDRFEDMMTELFSTYTENEREAIIDQYTNWVSPEDGFVNQRRLGEALGDSWFVCPHRKFADEWSNRGLSVYYYHFTERVTANPWAKWMGVMHGDDVNILFGTPFAEKSKSSFTDNERKMSENFLQMIGNFARVGVPSNNWERYTSEHPVYLNVNATTVTDFTTSNVHGPKANECAFWNKIFPLIDHDEHHHADLAHKQSCGDVHSRTQTLCCQPLSACKCEIKKEKSC